MNRELPILSGPRVVLRAPVASDAEGRLALGNAPHIHRMFGAEPTSVRDLTPEAAQSWVDNLAAQQWAWVMTHNERLIGSVRLHTLNLADHRAHLAIGILDEGALGQGFGTEAMRLVAKFAFDGLSLHRLTLRVLAFNERAIAAYRKVGFIEEGRERETALIDGVWHDDVIMGLLAHEFESAAD